MKRCLFIISIVSFLSCQNEAEMRQAYIENGVRERLEQYRSEAMKKCRSELMREVIEKADSVMLKDAYFDIPDSLNVPSKRDRPEKPNAPLPEFQKPTSPDSQKIN